MNPEALLKLYETRLNSRSFDAVAPLISADATFWFSDGSHRGLDQIRAAFEATWRLLQNETYWLEDVQWIVSDESVAVCLYRYRWRAEIEGKAHEGEGRGTTVMHQYGGDWKIVHEHLSRWPK